MGRTSLHSAIERMVEGLQGSAFPVRAPAKVNLCLEVTGRRSDGYHLLEMLNCSVGLCDELCLWFASGEGIELVTDPGAPDTGPDADNLVVKAVREFWSEIELGPAPVSTRIHLSKRIPVGAGLGGGSSDAAAVLRALTGTFGAVIMRELGLGEQALAEKVLAAAARCGADVPYAYVGGAALVSGIGEVVTPLRDVFLCGRVVIVCPRAHVNTREFYGYYRAGVSRFELRAVPLADRVRACSDLGALVQSDLIHNDFESHVCAFAPAVGEALTVLRRYFPKGSAVTGSGAAMFALLKDEQEAVTRRFEQEMRELGADIHRTELLA